MDASTGPDDGRAAAQDAGNDRGWSRRRPASERPGSPTDDRVRAVIEVARKAFGGGRRALGRRGD